MIKEITGLNQCERLKTLSLSENQIEKISGLDKLPLTYLDLVSHVRYILISFS